MSTTLIPVADQSLIHPLTPVPVRFPSADDSRYFRTIDDARRGFPPLFGLSDEALTHLSTLEDGADLQQAALVPVAAWNALQAVADRLDALRLTRELSAYGRNERGRLLLVAEYKRLGSFDERAQRARGVATVLAARVSLSDRWRPVTGDTRGSEIRSFLLQMERGERLSLIIRYVGLADAVTAEAADARETLRAILTAPLPIREVLLGSTDNEKLRGEIARALSPDLAAAQAWAEWAVKLATDATRATREWLDVRWCSHGGAPVPANRLPDPTVDVAAE